MKEAKNIEKNQILYNSRTDHHSKKDRFFDLS